jgi:hypothetical protein
MAVFMSTSSPAPCHRRSEAVPTPASDDRTDVQ